MSRIPTAPLVAAGLIGGFVTAQQTGKRQLGGAIFAACGGLAARQWVTGVGAPKAAALGGLYVAAMGGSHPLAKKIGPWPSVFAVTAVAAGASWAIADR